jgi:uncharacterized metal-binding protein (TIGR02443 family)
MQECMDYHKKCPGCGMKTYVSLYRENNNFINNFECEHCGYSDEEVKDIDWY